MSYYFNSEPPTIPTNVSVATTVRLVGSILDSGNLPIVNGWLEIKANQIFSDSSVAVKTTITRQKRRFPITSGVIDILLIPSIRSGVTYNFTLGITTPSTTIAGVVIPAFDTITDIFNAVLPDQQIINFSDLIPTRLQSANLDASVYGLANTIVNNVELRNQLFKVFNFTGPFLTTRAYLPFDVVFIPDANPVNSGASWICVIPSAPSAWTLPTSNFIRLF